MEAVICVLISVTCYKRLAVALEDGSCYMCVVCLLFVPIRLRGRSMTGVCWTATAALTWCEDRGLEDCGLRGGVVCLSVYVSLS